MGILYDIITDKISVQFRDHDVDTEDDTDKIEETSDNYEKIESEINQVLTTNET